MEGSPTQFSKMDLGLSGQSHDLSMVTRLAFLSIATKGMVTMKIIDIEQTLARLDYAIAELEEKKRSLQSSPLENTDKNTQASIDELSSKISEHKYEQALQLQAKDEQLKAESIDVSWILGEIMPGRPTEVAQVLSGMNQDNNFRDAYFGQIPEGSKLYAFTTAVDDQHEGYKRETSPFYIDRNQLDAMVDSGLIDHEKEIYNPYGISQYLCLPTTNLADCVVEQTAACTLPYVETRIGSGPVGTETEFRGSGGGQQAHTDLDYLNAGREKHDDTLPIAEIDGQSLDFRNYFIKNMPLTPEDIEKIAHDAAERRDANQHSVNRIMEQGPQEEVIKDNWPSHGSATQEPDAASRFSRGSPITWEDYAQQAIRNSPAQKEEISHNNDIDR